MTSVLINNRYGSFFISPAAVRRIRELTNCPTWGGPCLAGDVDYHGFELKDDYGTFLVEDRTDPAMIAVWRKMGDEDFTAGKTTLKLVDIPIGAHYRISEYRGLEYVEFRDSIEWSVG